MSPDQDDGKGRGDGEVSAVAVAEDVKPPFKLWLDRCVTVDGARADGGGGHHDEEGEEGRRRRSLRDASREYFSSVAATSSSAEDEIIAAVDGALAGLLADLGPAFAPPQPGKASTAIVRARALHLVAGAMEGCCCLSNGGEEEKSSSLQLSPELLRSVGAFLLPHCAYHDDEHEGVAGLAVRSSAADCLSVLLRSTARLKLEEDEIKCEEAGRVLTMAREGVAHLCAATGDSADDGGGVEGLSDLPRARRSECFDLLSSALVGFSGYNIQPPPSKEQPRWRRDLEVEMSSFASFSCLCLRGETDPRCLVQLLDVLHGCQRSFMPLFPSSGSAAASDGDDVVRDFPTVEMFDAVAPYYPIHFTPPPNDVHRITRDDLRDRLMSVLCCPSPSSSPHETFGEEGGGGMIALSCHLFLERVRGGAGDGGGDDDEEEITPRDQLEAMDDVRTLLRLGPEGGGAGAGDDAKTTEGHVILELDDGAVTDLSNALSTVFQSEAVATTSAMNRQGGSDESIADEEVGITVARGCTSLAVQFLSTLERIIISSGNDNGPTSSSSSKAAKSSWEAFFDASTLTRMTSRAASEPETSMGRAGVGYLAAMAVAGPETLRRCWDSCIPTFLATVTRYSSKMDGGDDGDGGADEVEDAARRATAALHGLAAFHSACLQVGRGGSGTSGAGVAIPAVHRYHPDPISRKYASDVFPALLRIGCLRGETEGSYPVDESAAGAATAAVSALETLLLAAPATSLPEPPPDEEDGDDGDGDDEDGGGARDSWGRKGVASAVDRLVDATVATPPPRHSARPWREACGRAVGSIVGSATSDAEVVPSGGESEDADGVLTTSSTPAFTTAAPSSGCLPTCLDAAELLVLTDRLVGSAVAKAPVADGGDDRERARWDRSALARACLLSRPAADVVVEELASLAQRGLYEASIVGGEGKVTGTVASKRSSSATDGVAVDPKSAATALSYVVCHGGENAVEAWRSLPIDRVVGIVEAAFPSGVSKREMGGASDGRLVLPGGEVKDRVERAVRSASDVLPHLIPCYERCGPAARLAIGRRLVSPILPPLSEMDQAKLRIALPVLAAALTTAMDEEDSDDIGENVTGEIAKVLPCLCDYALSIDTKGPARSAAVSCIHSIIYHGWRGGGGGREEEGSGSLASQILRDSVWPAVIESAEAADFTRGASAFVDAVNLAAIVGSAAACHGGSSAPAADSVVKFLVCLCCDGTVYSPPTDTYTLTSDPCSASVIGGSAMGNFIAVEGGGPFWRQRACALALPDLLRACRNTFRGGGAGDIGLGPAIGVAHFVCCVPMAALGTDDADSIVELVDAILRGLVMCYPDGATSNGALARGNARMLEAERRYNGSGYVASALAALLKLFSSSPREAVAPILSSVLVIQILLRIIAERVDDDRDPAATVPTHEVSRKLLALQCLLLIASRFPDAKGNRLQRANVVGGLSVVIDHPSRDVRRAAVRVRNVWSLMDGPKR